MRDASSSVGSIDVPSKDPNEVMQWDQTDWRTGWRELYDEEARIDGERGGYGIVLRVVERASDARFALKYLQSDNAESRARFKREIEQQKRLSHPHVVPVCRHGSNFDWYTMPIAAGCLSEFAAELSDDEIADVIDQVARALHAAHEQDIVHRDIKPANILLEAALPGEHRVWMVSDFGAARAPRGETGNLKTTTVQGTHGFIAPELFISPHENATPVADVFSLGRTLAWLTTGQTPTGLQPSPGRGIWAKLVERMTELQVNERMQTMAEVINGVHEVRCALRAERKARWGKPQPAGGSSSLGWREDRVIWTIVNEALTDQSLPELRPAAIEADLTVGEVRLTLARLQALGYVTREWVGADEDGYVVCRLTEEAVRYAAQNVDRLTAAYLGDGSDRPHEFERVRGRGRIG